MKSRTLPRLPRSLSTVAAALVWVMAVATTAAAEREWPFFRSAGLAVTPGAALPTGTHVADGTIEFVLKGDSARCELLGANGSVLISVAAAAEHGRHTVIVWGQRLLYYQPHIYGDGKHLDWSVRTKIGTKNADAQAWLDAGAPVLRITGEVEALRYYPYPFDAAEALNAYRVSSGAALEPLPAPELRFDYRYHLGTLEVTATVMQHIATAARAVATLELGTDRKPLTGLVPQFDGGMGSVTFAVGQLPVGTYPCTVALQDADGRELDVLRGTFERIELPWLNSRAGVTDQVFPPFEPVRVEGPQVSCVMRRVEVGDDGLLRSVVVQEQEILAAPVHFELRQAGTQVAVASRGTCEPARGTDAATQWRGVAAGGGIRFTAAATFEFDGLARYELTLAPETGPVALDSLSVAIPLKSAYAAYIHALPIGGSFRDYEVSRRLEDLDGVVWDSRTGFGKGAQWPTVGSFAPMVWLGGMIRGLCFVADNDRGWVPNDEHPAISLTRTGDVSVLRLHIVSAPFTLDAPRTIVFGLLPTPTKPVPPDLRAFARGNIGEYGPVAGRIYSCDSFAPWKAPAREQAFDIFPLNHDWERAEQAAAETRSGAAGSKYPPGQALMLYYDKPWGRSGRDGEYFDWEWKSNLGRRSAYTYAAPSLVDCRVWYLNEYLRRNIYDGIYIDDAFPTANDNVHTGSAYLLPDGRIQPGVSFFGFREFLKRTWNCFCLNGKRPIVTVHMTGTVIMPALTFATAIFDGEDTQRMGNPKYDFIDVWPLERYHVLDNPERTGLATIFMFKGSYADKFGKDPESQNRTYRTVWTVRLLHDLWINWTPNLAGPDGTRQRCLPILTDQYMGLDTTFHPYWKNSDTVTVSAELAAPIAAEHLPETWYRSHWSNVYIEELSRNPLRASFYRKKGRLLLAIGNYARVPVTGRVVLDPKALGIPAANLTVRDADEWPDWPETTVTGFDVDAGTLTMTVNGRNFRLFEFSWPAE